MDREYLEKIIEELLLEVKKNYPPPEIPGGVCDPREPCAGCGYCVVHKKEAVQNIIENGAERISATLGVTEQGAIDINIAKMIDHTLLKPEATPKDIEKLCFEAIQYQFASVCVNPCYVKLASEILKDRKVKVCTVIGFPLGANRIETKVFETEKAIEDGAKEVDMVMNIGMLKGGYYEYVEQDIRAVVNVAHKKGVLVKVILETALLTDEEKVKACLIAKRANADFVKTSTGFSKGGATAGDVALMRRVVGGAMGVKASGGIRTYEEALQMIKSGADRIGASASVKIVTGIKSEHVSTTY
ncbi:deoxyribose-phosphate aldolase [Candidatus Kryptonium thompsonii]|uniref:Deoxyribose-phosphate aldolase n=2 Tax=Candidatus Kryptonium thompsonii TaxID=1633631 RepID=A0A0P1P319_9BACT|nr:deoxyribose-phosphate aldolase [Candidatus Kryptonium thompsoni]CUS82034.1 deoxyribose-phosphate aldolase [Candidatus Kryptonium thompsoni]CUS84203.1 deoxyribose-phosphate aldolase [Candidatus Kryptonium thompsoni]CUS85442.1 deoxyribose-phosphate aldolase [Candidatus Kryptonium thompsoni]CUS92762.1 deoxyribose-phosphate aldolase [Candidatus Kryptonium thompsoni]